MNLDLMRSLIRASLREDVGRGDITSEALFSRSLEGEAEIVAREEGLVAGLEVAREVFRTTSDKSMHFTFSREEGDLVKSGRPVLAIKGEILAILTGERVALNFLSRISGIASATRKYVNLVKDLGVSIVDTRKTSPNLRVFEKYGVKVGGGLNHRFGLDDSVLIKDNHIRICGGITEALRRVKKNLSPVSKLEVEVENFTELKEAVAVGVDIVMLDNMDPREMRKAVLMIRESGKGILIEASGGVNLKNVRRIAETGVDFISVGAITHSPTSLNFALEII